jgi:hypothetical protein
VCAILKDDTKDFHLVCRWVVQVNRCISIILYHAPDEDDNNNQDGDMERGDDVREFKDEQQHDMDEVEREKEEEKVTEIDNAVAEEYDDDLEQLEVTDLEEERYESKGSSSLQKEDTEVNSEATAEINSPDEKPTIDSDNTLESNIESAAVGNVLDSSSCNVIQKVVGESDFKDNEVEAHDDSHVNYAAENDESNTDYKNYIVEPANVPKENVNGFDDNEVSDVLKVDSAEVDNTVMEIEPSPLEIGDMYEEGKKLDTSADIDKVCDDDLELADINDEGHANREAVHKELNVFDSTDNHIPIVDDAAENCVDDGINEQDTLIEAPTDTVVDVSKEENVGCDDFGDVTTPSNEEEKKVGDNVSAIDDSESTKGEDNHSSSEIVLDRETVEEGGLINDESEGQVVEDMTVESTKVVDEFVKDMVTDFDVASEERNELSGSKEVTSNDDDLKLSDVENSDGYDNISNKETDTVSELKTDESAVDVFADNASGDSICEKDIEEDQTNKETDTVSELKTDESAVDVVADNASGDSICEKDIEEDQTNKETDAVSELKTDESAVDVVADNVSGDSNCEKDIVEDQTNKETDAVSDLISVLSVVDVVTEGDENRDPINKETDTVSELKNDKSYVVVAEKESGDSICEKDIEEDQTNKETDTVSELKTDESAVDVVADNASGDSNCEKDIEEDQTNKETDTVSELKTDESAVDVVADNASGDSNCEKDIEEDQTNKETDDVSDLISVLSVVDVVTEGDENRDPINKETDTVSELKNDESYVVVAEKESGNFICEKDIVEDQTNKETDTVSELIRDEYVLDIVTEGDETVDCLQSHTDGNVDDTITAFDNDELLEEPVENNGPYVDPTLDEDMKANDDVLELANIDESEVRDKKSDCAEENINDKEVDPSIDSNVGASDDTCTPQMDQTTQEEDSTVSVVVDKSPPAEKELLVSHYSDDLDDMIAEFESEGRVSAECMDESTS